LVTLRPDGAGLPAVLDFMARRYPMFRVRSAQSLSSALSDSIGARRFRALLFGSFGLAAVVITGVGVFGLAAITASRRTHEVGVRMALGATPASVAGLMLRREVVAIAIGLGAGGTMSLWMVRLLRSSLYKMSVYDPAAWLTAVGTIVAVGTLGALIPAVRASRIDPARTLRAD
jgi:putative ABC transport system permease protein